MCLPVASASDLDLFDVGIPFPHLLHVPHQFFVEAVRVLLQDDLQLEDLPDVRQGLAQDLVSVALANVGKEEQMLENPARARSLGQPSARIVEAAPRSRSNMMDR